MSKIICNVKMLCASSAVDVLKAQLALSIENSGVMLTTYREQYQDAFSILISQGWKAEGGMIPSGVSWNVVDLVESNILFRIISPDGKSFFGWYPRFYFQDPQVLFSRVGVVAAPNRASFEWLLDLSLPIIKSFRI